MSNPNRRNKVMDKIRIIYKRLRLSWLKWKNRDWIFGNWFRCPGRCEKSWHHYDYPWYVDGREISPMERYLMGFEGEHFTCPTQVEKVAKNK